jgi:isopenicillin-N epimerase
MTLKDLFLLDPTVTFLNHGSFGATPRPVFEEYQRWQLLLERQPVAFMMETLIPAFEAARIALGGYVGADPADIVYTPNATFGVNVVGRSLVDNYLKAGDEVLATNHEYGACNNVWTYLAARHGFVYKQQPLSLPAVDPDAMVEELWAGVTERTKLIYISHITSATALCLPVEKIVKRAKEQGILTFIDGAHAPGFVPLDMEALGTDFYTGNLHKWLCAPKGSAFLYTRRERQPLIEPILLSWGWGVEKGLEFGSDYLNKLQFFGTTDFASYFASPAAIQFQAEHDWDTVRQECHTMVREAMHRLCDLMGTEPLYADHQGFYHQMASMWLPPQPDPIAFKQKLYADYRIEIPIMTWQERQIIRISLQGYNRWEDVERLEGALKELLK